MFTKYAFTFFKTWTYVLDVEDLSVLCKTLVTLVFNALSQLHPDLKLFLWFECCFQLLIASNACPSIHACCLITISLFHAWHPVFLWFSTSVLIPFACRVLALHGFSVVLFLAYIALGQWCLLSRVLWNQGMPSSEHWQRCWAHRSHVLFSIIHHDILSILKHS